jgi:hypothetical protein
VATRADKTKASVLAGCGRFGAAGAGYSHTVSHVTIRFADAASSGLCVTTDRQSILIEPLNRRDFFAGRHIWFAGWLIR